jgi:hypothetical protein
VGNFQNLLFHIIVYSEQGSDNKYRFFLFY